MSRVCMQQRMDTVTKMSWFFCRTNKNFVQRQGRGKLKLRLTYCANKGGIECIFGKSKEYTCFSDTRITN